MRVHESIKLVDGVNRSAVYDLNKGIAWPATPFEVQLLKYLSLNNVSDRKINKNPLYTKTLVAMRRKGWLELGSPVRRSLSIERGCVEKSASHLHNVWLELTRSCNLTCQHCYAESSPRVDRSNELSDDQWLEIVLRLLDCGVETITLIGGEPTIRMGLCERIAEVIAGSKCKPNLRIFSNFAIPAVSDRLRSFALNYGVELGTALYGNNAELHDGMTGVKGSWERALGLIRSCASDGIDVFVGLYLDFSKHDVDIEGIESWLKSSGVSSFKILPPSEVGRGSSKSWTPQFKKNSNQKIFHFDVSRFAISLHSHNCFYDHIAIQPDGNIAPCIMMRGPGYANAKLMDFYELEENPAYQQMRGLSKDEIEGCRDCEFRYACFDCRPDAVGSSGMLKRKPACGYDPRLPLGVELNEADPNIPLIAAGG